MAEEDWKRPSATTWIKRGAIARAFFLLTGELLDAYGPLSFTDRDFTVFMDAASLVWQSASPYNHSGFRYPPIIAHVLALITAGASIPIAAKIFFTMCDLLCGYLQLQMLLANPVHSDVHIRRRGEAEAEQMPLNQRHNEMPSEYSQEVNETSGLLVPAMLWLLNPLPMQISTRGNFDAVQGVFVLFALHKAKQCRHMLHPSSKRTSPDVSSVLAAAAAGASLGIAAHVRLYPCAFGLSILLYLPGRSCKAVYALAGFVTFSLLGQLSLAAYGWEYVDNALLNHLQRTDTKHNYSPFFYPEYLRAAVPICAPSWMLTAASSCKWLLLLLIGVWIGPSDATFACFLQSFTFVALNSHYTLQYVLWFLVLAPPAVGRRAWIEDNRFARWLLPPVCAWLTSLIVLWGVNAYRLEEMGQSVHVAVWASCECVLLSSAWLIATLARCWNALYRDGKA